jgi:serine/threonine-protein kinase
VCSSDLFAGNGEIAARFAREAMATGMFEHPNVASAIDFGTLPEGGAYFVMQLVRGQSLTALLRVEGRLPWRRAVAIGAQLADALSAAKAIDVVHRDLKPDNIIVQRREDGSDLVKILDFGIARHTRDSLMPPPPSGTAGGTTPRNLTREGSVVGTPGYMSPEQAMGDRVSHAADLYTLGTVIWECVAGRQLWSADDLSTLIKRQLTEPVPSLRALLPEEGIPEDLDRLVARLLAVSTRERPESAGLVRDALQLLLLASVAPAATAADEAAATTTTAGAPATGPATSVRSPAVAEATSEAVGAANETEKPAPALGEQGAPG